MEDKHCFVRRDLKMPNLYLKSIFPVTTLKSGILLQQFSFTLPAMITASSVKHMSAEKKRRSKYNRGKGKKYAKYHKFFLCQVVLVFHAFFFNHCDNYFWKITGQSTILVTLKVRKLWLCIPFYVLMVTLLEQQFSDKLGRNLLGSVFFFNSV